MTWTTSTLFGLVGAGAIATLVAGCGGLVSAAAPGDGKDGLGASGGDDAGVTGDNGSETGATPTATTSGLDAGADWPSGTMSALDGSVPDSGEAGFTEFIWQRWWDCDGVAGGPICQQEFWVNAACQAYWNDRGLFTETYALSASRCQEFQDVAASSHLAAVLQDPTPCPLGPNGGKVFELHLDGHLGPKYRKRVDGCVPTSGLGINVMEKLVLGAVRDDPHVDVNQNIPHLSME
jgi:hypothetical protein